VESLKAGSRVVDTRGTRIRGGLVVAQVALSMVLLTASGLLVRTFVHLRSVDIGFDPQGLLAADLQLPAPAYPDAQGRILFFTGLEERVRAIPGIVDVAMINRFPIRGLGGNTYVYPVGERPADGQDVRTANERWVMPGYFEAMGIPLLRGRGIEATDGPGAPPVLVIDQTMAREFFPDTDPLGQRLVIDFDAGAPLEVVGIVGEVRSSGLVAQPFPTMYHSYLQEPVTRMEVGVRVAGDAALVAPALREAVRELDPSLPISQVDRMDRLIAGTMGDQTVMVVILTAFAWVALGLTALGLYGVLAYFVTLRIPELGLRIALGARKGDLLRMVATRGLGLFAMGMVLGLAGAWGATRFIRSLLVGVEPTDPLTFAVISVAFAAVGAAASILPARRAFKVDPTRALQAE
jgi:putative ABC transport system permease protein